MKSIGFLLLIPLTLFLIQSCSAPKDKALQEIRRLEYLRDANPDLFIEWLNSTDESLRLAAVKALGRIQDEASLTWLANRLGDHSVVVRSAAAFAIGELFTESAEQPVLDALRLETELGVRVKLIEALGKVGSEKSFNIIRDYIEDNNPDYEKAAAIAAGMLAYRGKPAYNSLASLGLLLQARIDPEIRWRMAYGLYRSGSPVEFKALFNSLEKVDPLPRFFTLRALQVVARVMENPRFKDYQDSDLMKDATELISSEEFFNRVALCLQDTSWYVRVAALKLAGQLAQPILFEHVLQAVEDAHPHVRAAAIDALANYKNNSRDILERLVREADDWRTRGQALEKLAAIDPVKGLKIIHKTLPRLEWPDNYYHIRALKSIGTPETNQMLIQLAESDNLAQVNQVLDAPVSQLHLPYDFLIDKLKLADPSITTIVATNLAFRKEPRAVPHLIEVYQHFEAPRDIEPMESILMALDSIASKESIDFLETELNNPFPKIQQSAQKALFHITGRRYELPNVPKLPLTRTDFPPLNGSKTPLIRFQTNRGEFTIKIFPHKAPVTCANFVELVKEGFYDNIFFHRVVPGFVVQTGDPRGDGWGGPGYVIPCEYNDLSYDRGIVGMAHAGKDTGGSQFFITHTPQPHLNGRHTAFGKVISGMKVVDSLEIFDKILKVELVN